MKELPAVLNVRRTNGVISRRKSGDDDDEAEKNGNLKIFLIFIILF